MAVQPQTPYQEDIANGVTTVFPLQFDCDNKDHLIILIDGIEADSLTWSLANKQVSFTTPPALNKKITFQRNTPYRRDRNYQSYDNSFRPDPVNKDFDWIWWKLQELGVADWILSGRIDALKRYVDFKDDELRAYLMEEIRKQGVALDQLDDYYNYLMQRLAQIAVDKGCDASFVVDGPQTQKEINLYSGKKYEMPFGGYPVGAVVILDNGERVKSIVANNTVDPNADMTGWAIARKLTVESVAYLLSIQNPADGMLVFVKSYHAAKNFALLRPYRGGSDFVYISANASINNGGTIINGWTRIKDTSTVYFDDFGVRADGVTDDWDDINRAINSKSSTAYMGSWNDTSIRTTGSFEFGEGVHRITKPILLPPYTRIKGAGNRWYFAGDALQSNTIIKPDFSDIYQFAFQSANYVTATGELIGVSRNYSGVAVDSKEVTATLGIHLSGFSIEPVSKILGGIRLVASARSRLENIHITTVDMGAVMNSSWSSYVDITTQHDKTGLLIGWASNSCEVHGYYTGTKNAVLPNNFWKNHIESAASAYGFSSDVDSVDLKFGVFSRYNQGTYMPNIICEGNDYSAAMFDGDFVIGNIYSEKNDKATFLTYQAKVQISNTTGGLDRHVFEAGHRSKIDLRQFYQQYLLTDQLIKSISLVDTLITVPDNFNHIRNGVRLARPIQRIYVNATTGKDINVGSQGFPLKTANAALERISFDLSLQDSSILEYRLGGYEVVILDSTEHVLAVSKRISGLVLVSSTQATKPSLRFDGQIFLTNGNITFFGVSVIRPDVTYPTSNNGAVLFGDGNSVVNIVNSSVIINAGSLVCEQYLTAGFGTVNIRNTPVVGLNTTTIYTYHRGGDTTHGISICEKAVTRSGGIETRTDKGYEIQATNKVFTVGIPT